MDADNVIRMRCAILSIARRLNAIPVESGLTPAEASVLGIVVNRGPLSLARLSEITDLNPTMLSRAVHKLDSVDLIRRLRDQDASLAVRVEGTLAGEGVWRRISTRQAAIISERVASLSAEHEAALVASLPALENLSGRLQVVLGRTQQENRESHFN